MTLSDTALLFPAAVLAGLLNSIAGGGSFISFPALIFTRVLPIPANATSTVALWPGSVASVGAYRKKFPNDRQALKPLVATSLAGGVLGAVVLLHTPQNTFLHFVPYLFSAATLLLIFGRRLSDGLHSLVNTAARPRWLVLAGASLIQFLIAIYGGFFGGGIGILMLALLTMIKMDDIHSMNAVKALLAAVINGAAVVTFIVAGAVVWPQAVLMLTGAILGGYGGAHYAQKLNPELVRHFVIAVGVSMSIYFFLRT